MLVKINRYRNKIKRLTDALEKLGVAGVAGVALGLFQSNTAGLLGGLIFIALSIVLTKEDE